MNQQLKELFTDFNEIFGKDDEPTLSNRMSACCNKPVYVDRNICSKCGEYCEIVCPYCMGEGWVMDSYQSPTRIDPKMIPCPECRGTGIE